MEIKTNDIYILNSEPSRPLLVDNWNTLGPPIIKMVDLRYKLLALTCSPEDLLDPTKFTYIGHKDYDS